MIATNVNSILPNDPRMFYGRELSSLAYTEMWLYIDNFAKNRLDEALEEKVRNMNNQRWASYHSNKPRRSRPSSSLAHHNDGRTAAARNDSSRY